jgi:hypothetical protein
MPANVDRKQIADGAVSPNKLHPALREGRYWSARGDLPSGIGDQNAYDATFPTGANNTYAALYFRMGQVTVRYGQWLNSNAWGPERLAVGEAPNWCPRNGTQDFIEYTWCSYPQEVSGHNLTVEPFVQAAARGFDPMVISLKAKQASVLGHRFYVGFRKGNVLNERLEGLSDFACIGTDYNSGIGATPSLVIVDNVGDGTPNESVPTTKGVEDVWVAGETRELKVIIGKDKDPSGLPLLNFFVDGIEKTAAARFNFVDGDEIFPFIMCEVNGSSNAVGPEVESLEVAYLRDLDDHYDR